MRSKCGQNRTLTFAEVSGTAKWLFFIIIALSTCLKIHNNGRCIDEVVFRIWRVATKPTLHKRVKLISSMDGSQMSGHLPSLIGHFRDHDNETAGIREFYE